MFTLEEILTMEINMHKERLRRKGYSPDDWKWIEDDYKDDLSSQNYILGALAKDD
jgi:hypothetical protein